MKKKILKLEEISIQSFVTNTKSLNSGTIKGGKESDMCNNNDTSSSVVDSGIGTFESNVVNVC